MTVTLFRREMRQLLRFAFPLFIAQSAQMGTGVVDTIMAARYGEQDLAAISIGINIWLPVYLLILGTVFATATIVAQDFGGGRIEKIRQQLPQSLWVAVFLGLTLSPAIWYAGPILDLLGLNPTTRQLALDYAQMVALGMPATAIFQALRYHTQGLGITQPFAFAAVAGFLINVPLNYAFIFGEWGAPELGAKGCGIATAISMWLCAAQQENSALSARMETCRPRLGENSRNFIRRRTDWPHLFSGNGRFQCHRAVSCELRRYRHFSSSDRLQCVGFVLHTHAGNRHRHVNTHWSCYWRGLA